MTSQNVQNAHYRVQHIWDFQCKFYCFFLSLCVGSGTERITFKRESPKGEKTARDFSPPLNFALKKKKTKQNQEHDAAPQGIALVKGKNSNLLLFPLSLLRV